MAKVKIKLMCSECKKKTNHEVLEEIYFPLQMENANDTSEMEEGFDILEKNYIEIGLYYRIVKCLGCDTPAFWKEEVQRLPHKEYTLSEVMFPYWGESFREESDWDSCVPSIIKNIYSQTIKAFNYEMNVLCAAGIRAIIEGCCREEGIEGNLENKIDQLYDKRHISEKTKEALHKLRYMGNIAVHELEQIPKDDLKTGIEIVEIFLKTFYEMSAKQKRLTRK